MSIYDLLAWALDKDRNSASHRLGRKLDDDDQRLAKARGFADYVGEVAVLTPPVPVDNPKLVIEPKRRRPSHRNIVCLNPFTKQRYCTSASYEQVAVANGHKVLYAVNVYARQK